MQKQVAEVSLATALQLYDARITEQEVRVNVLECELFVARATLDNSKRTRMEFVRFVQRNTSPVPPNA